MSETAAALGRDMAILVERARSGDGDAFVELVQPLQLTAYRWAAAILGDPGEAQDAVQEATVRAWRSIHKLRDPATVAAWYRSIVLNECRRSHGRSWRSVLHLGLHRTAAAHAHESSDAARTFTVLYPHPLARVRFASLSLGVAVTVDHNVVRTGDGGRSFVPVAAGMLAEAVDLRPSGHAWIAGPSGIATSADFGRTWTVQRIFPAASGSTPPPDGPYDTANWRVHLHFADDTHGYVLYRSATTAMNQDGAGFYATADGGRTWAAEFTDGFIPNPTGESGAGTAPGYDVAPDFTALAPGSVLFLDGHPVSQPPTVDACRSTDSGAHSTCVQPRGVDVAFGGYATVGTAVGAGQDWAVCFSPAPSGGGRRLQVLSSADGDASWTVRFDGAEPR